MAKIQEESSSESKQQKKSHPYPSQQQNAQDVMDTSNNEGRNEKAGHKYMVYIEKVRAISGRIVENEIFQSTILVLILVNAIMMGIGTYDFVEENEKIDNLFTTVDSVFLIIFTIELCLQFIYRGFYLFKDGWLVFDFVTVVASWSFSQFQVIRAFRVFRALRLITRIKVLKNLVVALLSVLPRVGAIISLMLLVFYIFAVMFTQLFKQYELSQRYFVRLDWTFLTLFQMVTLDWAEISRELMEQVPWARYPIIAFILISSFIVYNLIVAVLCDAIFVLHEMKNPPEEDEVSDFEEEVHRLQKRVDDLTSQIQMLREGQNSLQTNIGALAQVLSDVGVIQSLPEGSNQSRNNMDHSPKIKHLRVVQES